MISQRIKQFFNYYTSSWWISLLIFFVSLTLFGVFAMITPNSNIAQIIMAILGWLFGFLSLFAFIGILIVGIIAFVKHRPGKGCFHLSMLIVCFMAASTTMTILMFSAMIKNTDNDTFNKNVTLPKDILLTSPLEELGKKPGNNDGFQSAIFNNLKGSGNTDTTISADIQNLESLHEKDPNILLRYLASSPDWRVFEENGNLFATRRWKIGDDWKYSLHGYYSNSDFSTWPDETIPNFQTRVTIGLSGEPWGKSIFSNTTHFSQGQKGAVDLSIGNEMQESLISINMNKIILEIFEQSKSKERRITKAIIQYINQEIASLYQSPSWDTIQKLLSGKIKQGTASFELKKSFQPGIYDSLLWINPGESGSLYLKAFEITKNIPLSTQELKRYTNEKIGWSNNPSELFYANSHFTIYEGDWGKPYGARFEVWFQPDSGAPERKLLEKNFKIEGWER